MTMHVATAVGWVYLRRRRLPQEADSFRDSTRPSSVSCSRGGGFAQGLRWAVRCSELEADVVVSGPSLYRLPLSSLVVLRSEVHAVQASLASIEATHVIGSKLGCRLNHCHGQSKRAAASTWVHRKGGDPCSLIDAFPRTEHEMSMQDLSALSSEKDDVPVKGCFFCDLKEGAGQANRDRHAGYFPLAFRVARQASATLELFAQCFE